MAHKREKIRGGAGVRYGGGGGGGGGYGWGGGRPPSPPSVAEWKAEADSVLKVTQKLRGLSTCVYFSLCIPYVQIGHALNLLAYYSYTCT